MALGRRPTSYLLLIQRWRSAKCPADNECFGQPQHEFASASARRAASELYNADEDSAKPAVGSRQTTAEDGGELASYNQATNVSLYSCMQSSVPEPYTSTPTHVSMPGGGRLRSEKYVYGAVQDTHPVRNYHTSPALAMWGTLRRHSPQGVQGPVGSAAASAPALSELLRNPCPQGIQGDECSQFKLWLSNCLRHDGVDCQKLASEYVSGRKTLSEIFQQYEREIKAVQYTQKRGYSTASSPPPSSQPQKPPAEERKPGEPAAVASAAATDAPEAPVMTAPQLSSKQKLQRAVKDYGSTVVVFHVTMSLASLGFFYVAVSSNFDVLAIMAKLGASQDILASLKNATTFVIAYAVHKMFAPVRIAVTLSATPVIVKYLRAKGILKPPKLPSS